jgi:hypothetical protein
MWNDFRKYPKTTEYKEFQTPLYKFKDFQVLHEPWEKLSILSTGNILLSTSTQQ